MVAHEDFVGGDGERNAILLEAEGAIVVGQVGVDGGSGGFGVEDLLVWEGHGCFLSIDYSYMTRLIVRESIQKKKVSWSHFEVVESHPAK